MSQKWGYCRCSTNEEKQNIGRQIEYCRKNGVPEENIITEYGSGSKEDRKCLKELLYNKIGVGDEIYCVELTRLSRSSKQLFELLDLIMEKRLHLVCDLNIDARNGRDGLNAMTIAYYQMAGVFAQLERSMIVERVRDGLAQARRDGKKLGRPGVTLESISREHPLFMRYYDDYRSGHLRMIDFMKITGLSRNTLCKYCSLMENGGMKRKSKRRKVDSLQ